MAEASYSALYRTGALRERVERAEALLERCRLCGRRCQVNRLQGEEGKCRTGSKARVSSFGPHFGEEAPLVGQRGSGTIFFAYCNLRCVYCQNFTISQLGEGYEVEADDLANMMLSLQRRGCHNINLVSPTHVVPQILAALEVAAGRGLVLPLVYNTGGYDSLETLELLDGLVDIYMPDMKYSDDMTGQRLSDVVDYPAVNRAAVKEMHRQVGDLEVDDNGVAVRGLLVRHLVLPHDLAGTAETARFLAEEISPNTYLNVMAQYRPYYRAREFRQLSRRINPKEYREALEMALSAGLLRLDGPWVTLPANTPS